ncbi:MAG TPA: hypothetical protein PLO43_00910 [Chlamydiales bacterium]|nr:hypothetical protein [Chlamydiales bacterium]
MKLLGFCLLVSMAFAAEKDALSLSTTHGTCQIDQKDIAYTAQAGTYLIKDNKGDPQAEIFFVAYTKDGEDPSQRPVTFCFNGGPGSSSIWLHMGALGPRKITVNDLKPQDSFYDYQNNPHSILDLTDLIFIDPVSTGYSRAAKDVSPKQFHGIDEDIQSVGEFIRLYVSRNGRWSSPKYLAGESYGTTRAAGLVDYLQDRFSMSYTGLILISPALNFRTLMREDDGNDLPFQTYLPTYSALAWYHQKLPPNWQEKTLPEVIAASKDFAQGIYNDALMRGHTLTDGARRAVVQKLSDLTSLNADIIEKHNLRIQPTVFYKKLLGHSNRRIGRMDGRVVGVPVKSSRNRDIDPSLDAVGRVFNAGFNDYVRNELKWEKDERYGVLENVFPWNFQRGALFGYPATDKDLTRAITSNPQLQVLVACGYYDLATPFFSTEYILNHLELDPSLLDHFKMTYYPAGHMMFLHPPSLKKLKRNIKEFMLSKNDVNHP